MKFRSGEDVVIRQSLADFPAQVVEVFAGKPVPGKPLPPDAMSTDADKAGLRHPETKSEGLSGEPTK